MIGGIDVSILAQVTELWPWLTIRKSQTKGVALDHKTILCNSMQLECTSISAKKSSKLRQTQICTMLVSYMHTAIQKALSEMHKI